MHSTCTKYLYLLCLLLFSVQVIFLYANIAEKSNPRFAFESILTENNTDGYNPFESSKDYPEQEEQEESQESEENEGSNELEVFSDDLSDQQTDFQLSQMNYYYLLKPSDGVNEEQYCPPECKV